MTTTSPWWLPGGRVPAPLPQPPSCPWRRTAGPLGVSSPAPRCPSRSPPSCPALGLSRSPCRSCPGVVLALPGPPSYPSRQIDKRQAPAPRGMPAALPCPSVPPAPSPPSCLPGPSALSFPPAALPLSPRCGRCASPCPSLQPERQTAGACAPQDARRLLLPACLSHPVCVSPVPLCPVHLPPPRQKDKRQARPPRCEPCRLLLPPLHLSRSLLPLPFRWARYTSRTERQTAGARAPLGALPPSPARPCRRAPPEKGV
jgi:hypothetical protein